VGVGYDEIRYSGIQLDTARCVRIQLVTVGYGSGYRMDLLLRQNG